VGLTLVRSLVEMHDGKIQALSDGPGRGSRFCVEFPMVESKTEGKPKSDSESTNGTAKRIVLVEDDDDAREMMANLMLRCGHDVLATAGDGLQGLEAIVQHKPQVAILDIGLPKLDGFALARQIRSELDKTIYLIALTGYGRDEDRDAVIEAGFNYHLVKPVSAKELDAHLRSIQ
jgi:two-component system CheB/CheR fusion protein